MINENLDNVKGKMLFFTLDGSIVRQIFEPAYAFTSDDNVRTNPSIEKIEMKKNNDDLIYSIEYNRSSLTDNEIKINLTDTMVEDQVEWLVFINDLVQKIPDWKLASINRADKETFLNEAEKKLSTMFSYGIFRV